MQLNIVEPEVIMIHKVHSINIYNGCSIILLLLLANCSGILLTKIIKVIKFRVYRKHIKQSNWPQGFKYIHVFMLKTFSLDGLSINMLMIPQCPTLL